MSVAPLASGQAAQVHFFEENIENSDERVDKDSMVIVLSRISSGDQLLLLSEHESFRNNQHYCLLTSRDHEQGIATLKVVSLSSFLKLEIDAYSFRNQIKINNSVMVMMGISPRPLMKVMISICLFTLNLREFHQFIIWFSKKEKNRYLLKDNAE